MDSGIHELLTRYVNQLLTAVKNVTESSRTSESKVVLDAGTHHYSTSHRFQYPAARWLQALQEQIKDAYAEADVEEVLPLLQDAVTRTYEYAIIQEHDELRRMLEKQAASLDDKYDPLSISDALEEIRDGTMEVELPADVEQIAIVPRYSIYRVEGGGTEHIFRSEGGTNVTLPPGEYLFRGEAAESKAVARFDTEHDEQLDITFQREEPAPEAEAAPEAERPPVPEEFEEDEPEPLEADAADVNASHKESSSLPSPGVLLSKRSVSVAALITVVAVGGFLLQSGQIDPGDLIDTETPSSGDAGVTPDGGGESLDPPDNDGGVPGPVSPPNETRVERLVHREVNEERFRRGISNLSYSESLQQIAEYHSADMLANQYTGHVGPDGETMADRYDRFNYLCTVKVNSTASSTGGENVLRTYFGEPVSTDAGSVTYTTAGELAAGIVDGWMASPGHRDNLLADQWDREGIGVEISSDGTVYVTQNFC